MQDPSVPANVHSGNVFLYRPDGIYLDVSVAIVLGHKPRGILPGFNGIQLYSFARERELEMILTNGSPSWRPRPLLARMFEKIAPLPDDFIIDVTTASDLPKVLAVHEEKLRGRSVICPTEEILESRWRLCDELELDDSNDG
jgi:hypothetical protein